jgi:hypothetical protein
MTICAKKMGGSISLKKAEEGLLIDMKNFQSNPAICKHVMILRQILPGWRRVAVRSGWFFTSLSRW